MIYVGVSVNLGDGKEILFIVVCKWNYLIIVKELILNKVDVNFRIGDKIFLIILCYEGYI